MHATNCENAYRQVRLLLAFILALGFAALSPSGAAAMANPCPPGHIYRGTEETATEIITNCEPVTNPALPPCDQLPATLKALQAEAQSLRRELQRNTTEAARISSALDDWVGLHENARRRAREKALKLGTELAVNKALEKLQATARLHHQLNVQEAGLLRREWAAIVGRLSKMSPSEKSYHLNRIANANTAEQGVKALKAGIDSIRTANEVGEAVVDPTREERLEAIASTLELVEKLSFANPYTNLLIKDLKSHENATYGWWAALAARGQLKSFIALEDSLLAESIRESSRYVLLSNAISAFRRRQVYCRPTVS